jgi:hypothetical protein
VGLAGGLDNRIDQAVQNNLDKAGVNIKCIIQNKIECPYGLDMATPKTTAEGDKIYPVFLHHNDSERLHRLQADGISIHSIMPKIATARLTVDQIRHLIPDPAITRIHLSGIAKPHSTTQPLTR